MKEIVFATNNKNKLREVRSMINPGKIKILSLEDINCFDEIPEPHDTLSENALAKAKHVRDKFGYDCFADDTGLEIEALGGKPGVYSARYAGEASDSHKNMLKVLSELHAEKNRKAQFRTVISLLLDNSKYEFEGIVKGEILDEIRGEKGFGYDPVFVPEGENRSFAEMSLEEKNKISHRARAISGLMNFLNQHEF